MTGTNDLAAQLAWDKYYLNIARAAAVKSKDTTQVGCVLVDKRNRVRAVNFNGPPSGVSDKPERRERLAKYLYTVHAEANAVAVVGADIAGGTAYITLPPCAQCAGLLIQAGVRRVVVPAFVDAGVGARWFEHFQAAQEMFAEADVDYETVVL